MKLSNKEKIILAVFLAVVIIVAGVFLIILPEYNKIEPNRNTLANVQAQRDQVNQTLLREATIDQEIQTALDKANEFSGKFYDDLTTYQADMILRDILKETNLETDTLSITDFTTRSLTLTEDVDAVVKVSRDLSPLPQSTSAHTELPMMRKATLPFPKALPLRTQRIC